MRAEEAQGSLVHDSEAVRLQGRGCHPRGQAKGSEHRAHIEQSPPKAQRSAVSASPASSQQQQQQQLRRICRTKSEVSQFSLQEGTDGGSWGVEVRARGWGVTGEKPRPQRQTAAPDSRGNESDKAAAHVRNLFNLRWRCVLR